ncbi:MAG: DUF4232 domain-containing protein [Solirubrobacterales bacterium]
MVSISTWSKRASAAATVVALAVIFTVVVVPSAAAPKATASAAPPCKTSGLDIWFENEIGGGTAGSVFYRFQFTNLSGHTCTLKGYPKVLAVNLKGQQIGSPASHETTVKPHLVKLAPEKSAPAVIRIVDAENFPPSACHPVTAAGFRVSPPQNTASRLVPFPFRACSKVGNGNLSVRVVGSK